MSELKAVIADPVRFARGVLRQSLWPLQEQILRAVARAPQSRTSVKACHASGKSFVASSAVLWWVTHYADGVAITTAPTWTQVERILWGEIHRAVARSRIAYPQVNKTELRNAEGNYALGLSTNEGVRFQGFHGRILIVLDEAPGVLPDIYQAIEGIRASGDVRVLELGNPTIASGPFYDSHTTNRAHVEAITISAFDTPNLAGVTLDQLLAMGPDELDHNPCPYLTTRRWVREKYDEWGPTHPLWQSRVLGEFPLQAEDALISLAWLEAAKLRRLPTDGPFDAGIDVAGPGEDETAVVVRQGSQVVAQHAFTQSDPRGAVVAALAPYRSLGLTVNVDAIGIGYNFGLHLRDQGFTVNLINVGEKAFNVEKFANSKAEYYWGLRLRCEAGDVAGLTDERTIGQLAGIRYKHNARGQVVIESKEDARKRGVKSPDRAEAVMLAYAKKQYAGGGVATRTGGV